MSSRLRDCQTTEQLCEYFDANYNVRVQVDFHGRRFKFVDETVRFREMVKQLQQTINKESTPKSIRKALVHIDRYNNLGNQELEKRSKFIRLVVFARSLMGKMIYNGYSKVNAIRRTYITQFDGKLSKDISVRTLSNKQIAKKILETTNSEEKKAFRIFISELVDSKTPNTAVKAKIKQFLIELEKMQKENSITEQALFNENREYYKLLKFGSLKDWRDVREAVL